MAEREPEIRRDLRIVWGVVLLLLCLFGTLSLYPFSYDWRDISVFENPPNTPPHNLFGPVGAWFAFAFFITVGLATYAIPVVCAVYGVVLLFSRGQRVWPRALWCTGLLLALATVLQLQGNRWALACDALNLGDDPGGALGYLAGAGMVVSVGSVGAAIVAWVVLLGCAVMFVGPRVLVAAGRLAVRGCSEVVRRVQERIEERQDKFQRLEKEEREIEKQRRKLEKTIRKKERTRPAEPESKPGAELEPEPEMEPEPEPEPEPEKPKRKLALPKLALPKREKKEKKKAAVWAPPVPAASGEYKMPPITLLVAPSASDRSIEADTGTTSRILTETLAEFGIEAKVTDVQKGPVVTRYELLPAPGVRVERISGLSNNLALALKATSLRVQAPVPGKGVVGIEVPNTSANIVYLREILEGDTYRTSKARLPLVLGQDVAGKDIVSDLSDMPHLLIAGATGSGKTVCMNSILAGLLMSRTPEQVKLMLVDPKIVEFSVYKDLPHLVVPVITQPKKVALGLRWAINEMENRYKLFARIGVRNIESYNNRVIAKQEDLFEEDEDAAADAAPDSLPYIVIVIDELADLMLAAQSDIENCIARLAQLSRAVGIHMILATQRPSVNVITGTIKANFPARIAFQVAQKVDSRTILDSVGAEKLLGRGDMLFLPPGTAKIMRAQGAMTSDAEIRQVTDFIKEQRGPVYEVEIAEKMDKPVSAMDESSEDEDILSQAVEIIRETQRASTSSLQRRLRIGYTRAARIMDILEERGIVGPPRGSEPREILIDLDAGVPDNPEEEPEPEG